MSIIFYDIPISKKGIAWNPNTWKARYALNIKGIPYKTEWVEYPDIEPFSKKIGIPPTSTKSDGTPLYTLPAIYDPFTKTYVSESLLIVEYLEKTYPNTPSLFPHNTNGLQTSFQNTFMGSIDSLWKFILPTVALNLSPLSAEYFYRERQKAFGVNLEDLAPKGEEGVAQWAAYRDGLGKVEEVYARNGGKGPFLLGDAPSWGDVVVASFAIWLRIIWGEDSQEWKDVKSWHGGRWGTLIESLKKYEMVA